MKKKIVLGSVLKPVNDTRIYEKFAYTLYPHYDIYIVAHKSSDSSFSQNYPNIYLSEIFDIDADVPRSKSSSLFLKELNRIRPDAIIVHTVELLPAVYYYKAASPNTKVFYDIIENYVYNIFYQNIHTGIKKHILTLGTYLIEKLSPIFISHYFAAEQTYLKEKSLPPKKTTILENKLNFKIYSNNKHIKPEKIQIELLLCGTISTVFGAKEAFFFAEKLHKQNSNIRLHIIGSCVEEELKNWLFEQLKTADFLKITGLNKLVPHADIINAMREADFVLLSYQPNKSTKDCIPTKMYECWALGIPMIIQKNQLWESLCMPYNSGFFINYKTFDAEKVMPLLFKGNYYPDGPVKSARWETEAEKLLKILSNFL